MHSMRIIGLLLLFVLCDGLTACDNTSHTVTSRIRIADFLLPDDHLELEITGPEHQKVDLNYGKVTPYLHLPEGTYELIFRDHRDSVILKKKLGIGMNASYTFSPAGIIPQGNWEQSQTIMTRLTKAFEGAAAHPDNAMMPIMPVWLDRFEGDPKSGNLKIVHVAAGMTSLEVFIQKKGSWTKLTKLAYPRAGKREYPQKPGTYPVEVRYAGSDVVLFNGNVSIRKGVLTTLFIYRDGFATCEFHSKPRGSK